jgi:hypothetical protein
MNIFCEIGNGCTGSAVHFYAYHRDHGPDVYSCRCEYHKIPMGDLSKYISSISRDLYIISEMMES